MDYSANPDVAALQRLCEREGGTKTVAEAIGVNDQSIYQIVTRKTLLSGREKGVGPNLRDKLNARNLGAKRSQFFRFSQSITPNNPHHAGFFKLAS